MSQLDFTHPQETIGTGVDIDMSQDKHLNFFVFLPFLDCFVSRLLFFIKKKGEKVTHTQIEKKRKKKKKKKKRK